LQKIPFWSREHSAILINFYKNHPCLYSTSHPEYKNKRKRNEAVKKVTERLMATTGKYFHAEDVRRKISLIRGQFLYEYKKIKKSESLGEVYTPTLWCFEMLSFLKEEYSSKKRIGSKASQNQANLVIAVLNLGDSLIFFYCSGARTGGKTVLQNQMTIW
jgi:hypothetical protein